MNSLYLELMDNFLDTELDAGFDSLSSRREVTNDQYNMLQEHWARVDRTVHEDLVRISPFSPFDADTAVVDEGGHGLLGTVDRPTSVLFSHPYNGLSQVDLDLIKRQALFFSRVAVVAPQPGRNSTPEEVGLLFSQFLKTLADLRPLIMDGTVELVPIAGFYASEIEGGAGIVRNICASDPAVSKWIVKNQVWLEDFAKTARRGDPYFDAGIRICSALAYGHNFAATHQFVGGLFRELLSERVRPDRSEIAAVGHLSQIHLPGFENLTWSDIKSVRDHEESLSRWRADLRDAIHSVDPDLAPSKFIERFDSQVQARLMKAAGDLDRELAKSSGLARFKKGVTELAISGIAAATTGYVFGPAAGVWQAVLEVMRSDGPKEALRLLWESKEKSGERSLRSHYAVFSASRS